MTECKRGRDMKNTSVLGVPLSMINRQKLLEEIEKVIRRDRQMTVVAINARKIVRTLHDPAMKRLLMGLDVFLADGSSVVKAADSMVERITGIDLMEDICRCSEKIGAKIFFYGASEENNLGAQKRLKKLYPGIKVAGYCNGYDDKDVMQKIRKSRANVVFVAKGTPLQEQWIMKYGKDTGACVLMGVGGAFDVFAGQLNRAPGFIQNIGLEWLYRMIREPKRFKQIPELLEFRRLAKKRKKAGISKDKWRQHMQSREITVVGLGYIGLPTAVVTADAGHHVKGFDAKKEVCESLSAGKIHIVENHL